jgi:WD40 repeat protein
LKYISFDISIQSNCFCFI